MAKLWAVNGQPLAGVDGEDVFNLGVDPTTGALKIASYVWDTSLLQWVRMTQPSSSGESGSTLDTRLEYDTDGNPTYKGYNALHGASVDATTWLIYKYTWSSGNATRIEGPLVGAWSDKENLF